MKRKERKDKKENNIIIKRMKRKNGRGSEKKVEEFIKEKIKVEAEVKYARKMGIGNMILAKIGTFEEKTKIMVNKKILGPEDIYIENDRIKKERKVQRMVVEITKKEAEKDRAAVVKIGHWKMTVNGVQIK